MESLFEEAQKSEEISKRLTPTELVNCINGMATSHIFSRRIKLHKRTFKQEFMANIEKFLELLKDDCERK